MQLLDSTESVLLIIDLQTYIYPPHRRDVDRSQLARVVENVSWISAVAKAVDVPVIVTEEDYSRNGSPFTSVASSIPPGSTVHAKHSFGVAGQEEIMKELERTEAKSVVITGAETDICVCHSALGLQEAGFRVSVVGDAVYSPGDAHAHGISRMVQNRIDVLSSKQVLYDWLPRLELVREFRSKHPEIAEPQHFNL